MRLGDERPGGAGPEIGAADLDGIAERILDLVGSRGEAAVTVTRSLSGLTRFANSFIHQNVGDEAVTAAVEVVVGGRTAAATTSRLDGDGLERLVHSALAAAEVRPVDPAWAGLSPPQPSGFAGHYDQATAEAGPAERAAVVAAFVEAGDGLEAAGYCETSAAERVFANSLGHRIAGRATTAAVDGIHRLDGADGCASTCSSRLADLDGARAGARASERARAAATPVEMPPGRYEVVLEPRCVAYMMDFLSVYGFNARAVIEGRSFASVGEGQFDPALSIWDDATDPRHIGFGFDVEGTPKSRLDLVRAGVVSALTHDRRTAARMGGGALTTGHAVAGGESLGAVARNLFLGPSGTPSPAADLVAAMERGLLVSDFWYARVLDPKTVVVTGLTRNGVFLVEEGKVSGAVTNLRFTQSPVAAFGPGKVLGVGDDGALAPGGLHLGWNHSPSLRLAQWNFTGNASG
ncbi:MAG TPA: metallopeptidase TldD-related protein [Acidimicrobiales bacterium]|nr:metallopeptidase TldD-related protein [Acidimicrobiales bacterium]